MVSTRDPGAPAALRSAAARGRRTTLADDACRRRLPTTLADDA
jgi:hypothetical protein